MNAPGRHYDQLPDQCPPSVDLRPPGRGATIFTKFQTNLSTEPGKTTGLCVAETFSFLKMDSLKKNPLFLCQLCKMVICKLINLNVMSLKVDIKIKL